MSAAIPAAPLFELDARLVAILAFAAPVERGAVVIDRLRRSTADGDARAARLLGNPATTCRCSGQRVGQAAQAEYREVPHTGVRSSTVGWPGGG